MHWAGVIDTPAAGLQMISDLNPAWEGFLASPETGLGIPEDLILKAVLYHIELRLVYRGGGRKYVHISLVLGLTKMRKYLRPGGGQCLYRYADRTVPVGTLRTPRYLTPVPIQF